MSKGKDTGRMARSLAVAALLGGAAFCFSGISELSADPGDKTIRIEFAAASGLENSGHPAVRAAVARFIGGMVEGDVDTVWMFASEEDQDAFGTERAVYDAFAEVFPALTSARKVTFEHFWQEGETPFVTLSLATDEGESYRATIGLWLDDAGDWELISCSVEPAGDRVA
jgi:hypothetical protein